MHFHLQLLALALTLALALPADEGSRESVDAGCRKLTAAWVREKAASDPLVDLCEFYEGLEKAGPEVSTPSGP